MDHYTSDDSLKQIYNTMEEERSEVDFLVPEFQICPEMISSFKSALVEYQVSSCKGEIDQTIRGIKMKHWFLCLFRFFADGCGQLNDTASPEKKYPAEFSDFQQYFPRFESHKFRH